MKFFFILFATLGQFSLAAETSVSDLLTFAEPKYNRAALKKLSEQYGFQLSWSSRVQENIRLKNALETLNNAEEETVKQQQWNIIVEEFYQNTLLPDAFALLEHLPEKEQIHFLTACLNNGNIMDERHRFRSGMYSGRNSETRWLDRGLCGTGIIKQMRYELLKKLLLRRDFENAEKLIEVQPSRRDTAGFVYAEFSAGLPISLFKEHAEIKDFTDYYRFLEDSGETVSKTAAGFYADERKQRVLDAWKILKDKWAWIAVQQALFQDFDLAIVSAQKIADESLRLSVLFDIAMTCAAYGNMEKAFTMWENFPPAMSEKDFMQTLETVFSYYRINSYSLTSITVPFPKEEGQTPSAKTYLLLLLLKNQMQGGIQAEAIPVETILPMMKDDLKTAIAFFEYFYANQRIKELNDLIEQHGHFDTDQYQTNYGSNSVATLCRFVQGSLLLGEKEESHRLLAQAFELMRNIDEKEDAALKKKAMYAIADTRKNFQMYDHKDAFTRAELAFSNPPNDGYLPWFMFDAETQAMREREIGLALGELRYSENPFFAAAAKEALKHDRAEALISTGKGLAKTGEKELSVEYYRHAVSMAQNTPRSDMMILQGIISVYGSIALNLIATETESPLLDEMFLAIQNARTQDNYTQYSSSTNAIAKLCIEMQNDALFEKFLQIVPESDHDYLKQSMLQAKRQAEFDAEHRRQQQEGIAALPPVRRAEAVSLPKPETEFDFYAGEFRELEGWRNPLALLLKKMPTPDEARQAVQRVLDDKEDIDSAEESDRSELLKKGEPINDAVERVKALPHNRQYSLDSHLLALALACIRHGRLDDALFVVKDITHDVPKADILLAVAFRQYDLADDEQKIANEAEFFKLFEEHQTQYGNAGGEERQMDIYFRDERYCAYIIRLAQRGLMDRAEANLKKVMLSFQRAEAVYTISMKYALSGGFEKALRLAQTMRDDGTGSFTVWDGGHGDGMGPYYSKLQTMTMILNMAASGDYGGQDFQPISFIDKLETNDAKVHMILAVVSHENTTNLVIGRSFLGMPFRQNFDVPADEDKPLLQDSEVAKNLLQRALSLTRAIDNRRLRETVLLELLPFLTTAKMYDESYQAADLIDTSGDYAAEQKEGEYSYSTIIPSHIASVVSLLIAEQKHEEALVLCQKVIDWIKPLKYAGDRGDYWSNRANDVRNEVLCRYAEFQNRAGASDKARQTLTGERDLIISLTKKGPYLQRVAEVQSRIGDRDVAGQTYIEAVSHVFAASTPMHSARDQFGHFDAIIESYCGFYQNNEQQ